MGAGIYILTGLLAGAVVVGGVVWYVGRTDAARTASQVQPAAWQPPPPREENGGSSWVQDFGTFAGGVGELAGAVDRWV